MRQHCEHLTKITGTSAMLHCNILLTIA